MKIKLHKISVREVVAGCKDSPNSPNEGGVVGYDGKLNFSGTSQSL